MANPATELERYVREAAALAGLRVQAHHLPGVVEHFERLAAQAGLLEEWQPAESDEPAPVYAP